MASDPSRAHRLIGNPILVGGVLAVICVTTGLAYDLYADERWGWVAAIRLASAPTWTEALRYDCTTGPLLIGLWASVGVMSSYSISGMRLVQVLFGLAAFFSLHQMAEDRGHPTPIRPAVSLIAAPYFLTSSVFLYSDVAGLLPLLLLVRELERPDRGRPWILGILRVRAGISAAFRPFRRPHGKEGGVPSTWLYLSDDRRCQAGCMDETKSA